MFGVKAQSDAPTHSHIPQRHTHTHWLHFHSYCPKHNLIGWDRLTAGQMFQRRHTWEVRTCVLSFQHVWILTPWTGELSQPLSQTDPTEINAEPLKRGTGWGELAHIPTVQNVHASPAGFQNSPAAFDVTLFFCLSNKHTSKEKMAYFQTSPASMSTSHVS